MEKINVFYFTLQIGLIRNLRAGLKLHSSVFIERLGLRLKVDSMNGWIIADAIFLIFLTILNLNEELKVLSR